MNEPFVYLAELTLRDPGGAPETLYFADAPIRPFAPDDPDRPNQPYQARILEVPNYSVNLFGDLARLAGDVGAGELTLSNADGALSYLQGYTSGTILIRRGCPGMPWRLWRSIVNGRAGAARWTARGRQAGRISYPIYDLRADLDGPVIMAEYAGTNAGPVGYEGDATAKNRFKPLALGDLTTANLPAVWANAAVQVAQLSAEGLGALTAIYDRGLKAEWTALGDFTGAGFDLAAPVDGQFATDLSRGLVKLGGRLLDPTFDCRGPGPTTAAGLLEWVLRRSGVVDFGSEWPAFLTENPAPAGLWLADAPLCRDIVEILCRSLGCYCLPDALGVWRVGRLRPPGEDVPLFSLDQRNVLDLEIADAEAATPVWEIGVRFGRLYKTMQRVNLAEEVLGTARETALGEEWRTAWARNSAVQGRWPDARSVVIETALTLTADAEALAARLLSLFGARGGGEPRQEHQAVVEMTDAVLDLPLGGEGRLRWPADGLDHPVMLIGMSPCDPRPHLCTLTVIG